MGYTNEHIKAPLFVERDYYDIPRAARMLGVEVEDIYHWIDMLYIGLYIKIDTDFFDCSSEERYASFWHVNTGEEWDKDILNCFRFGREIVAIDDNENQKYDLNYLTDCYGVWKVSSLVLSGNEYSNNLVNKKGHHIVILGKEEMEGEIYIDGWINKSEAEYSFILASNDVRRLYDFLYAGKPLERMEPLHREEELRRVKNTLNAKPPRKPRTQPEQIDLIDALIRSHPDIDTELLQSPTRLHKALGEMFARKGIRYPVKASVTYKRWFKF